MNMTKKQMLELIAKQEELIKIANSKVNEIKKEVKIKAILISTTKNSVMHIATNSAILVALRESTKATDFIISDKFEENVTSNNLNCEVVRVTDSFKDFCRNAIIKTLKD